MSRKVFVVYSSRVGREDFSEPLHVCTTEKEAKAWAFDNSNGLHMNIKPFDVGGESKPRAPKAAAPLNGTAAQGEANPSTSPADGEGQA